MSLIKVVGIDPAFANIGVCCGHLVPAPTSSGYRLQIASLDLIHTEADKAGKKVVRKNSDDLRRAQQASRGLRSIISDFKPAMIFAEVPTGAQSARAAWALGIAVGVLAGIDGALVQVLPREVKEAVGERHAGKEEIIEWALKQHPEANWYMRTSGGKQVSVNSKNEHLADAVATIYAGLLTDDFKRSASMLSVMRSV
jgi:Holliday junction resolvasome RuvABC endonuclease subunit